MSPGKYEGSLSLSPLPEKSPALSIELRSRIHFLWAFLLIFLGVVVAGVLLHHLGLRRRKWQVRNALVTTVERYCEDQKRYPEDDEFDCDASMVWSLEETIGCQEREDGRSGLQEDEAGSTTTRSTLRGASTPPSAGTQ